MSALVRAVMTLNGWRHWRPVERMARDPEAAQAKVLRDLLARHQGTSFGRKHGFSGTRTCVEFQSRVPTQDYETLRPYIDEQRRTGVPALTVEPPIFYAQTSGTTGAPKYVPITKPALELHKAEQALFAYLQYRARRDAYAGRALGIMGAAVEGRLDTGHAVGSVSGHLYQSLPRAMQRQFVVPPAVSAIADYELKYEVILHLALAAPDITYIGSPNPSTFLKLLGELNRLREQLLETLATGRCATIDRLDPAVGAVVSPLLGPNPARARELQRLGRLTFANTWPGIRLVTTWTGGSCGIALDAVRATLPASATVMELGYQSTECRSTIALTPETGGGLPVLHHHFFEFAPAGAWDAGRPTFHLLADLQPGERYYVLVTTASGLYRYFMNDLVEVTGMFEKTPLLRFVQKGKGVTNLTGEKLYESQMVEAVQAASRERGHIVPFFVAVAEEQLSRYQVFAEMPGAADCQREMAAWIDRRLGDVNIEYRSKRASGRLHPLVVTRLKAGAAEAYKAACVAAGQREGQFKPVVLQYQRDLKWDVSEFVEP